jgi:hypothetical protein
MTHHFFPCNETIKVTRDNYVFDNAVREMIIVSFLKKKKKKRIIVSLYTSFMHFILRGFFFILIFYNQLFLTLFLFF